MYRKYISGSGLGIKEREMERLQESPVILLGQEVAKITSYIEPESKLVNGVSDGSMEKERWKMTAYGTLHTHAH